MHSSIALTYPGRVGTRTLQYVRKTRNRRGSP